MLAHKSSDRRSETDNCIFFMTLIKRIERSRTTKYMKTLFSNVLFIDECLDITDDPNRWKKDCLAISGNKHQQLVNGVRIWGQVIDVR